MYTLAVIKPHAIRDKNIGNILSIIELDFDIVAMRYAHMKEEDCKSFYKEHKDKDFFERLISGMAGPWLAIWLSSDGDTVKEWREAMVDIRKLYSGKEKHNNAVHGSDSNESAQREIQNFFFHGWRQMETV